MRRIALLATLASLLLAAIAMAAPSHDGTFDVSGQPEQITAGPDGNVWFVISNSSDAKKFGRIEPDGTITEFNTPDGSTVTDITAAPDGKLWMAREGGVVEWDPLTLTGDEHPIASIVGARGIAADADGNLWVVRDGPAADGLTEVDPDGLKVQDVDVPLSSGREIALGSDGRMWWTDFNNAVIHATGTGTDPATDDHPVGQGTMDVVAGPDGEIAYTAPANQPYEVGRITTAGAVTPTVLGDVEPFGITFALDEAYWFAQPGADSLGRLTPDGGYTSPVEFDTGSDPRWVAAGPGGTLWVSLKTAEQIARITGLEAPAPTPTPTPTPTPGGPGGGDTVAPVIDDLAVRPRRSRRARRKRTVSFSLSEEAVLALRVERSRKGRRRGKKCVAPKRGTGKRCRRWVRVATLERGAGAGSGSIVVERRLARGRYRIRAVARDAAQNASEPATARFRVRG